MASKSSSFSPRAQTCSRGASQASAGCAQLTPLQLARSSVNDNESRAVSSSQSVVDGNWQMITSHCALTCSEIASVQFPALCSLRPDSAIASCRKPGHGVACLQQLSQAFIVVALRRWCTACGKGPT